LQYSKRYKGMKASEIKGEDMTVKQRIKTLEVGQSYSWPIERVASIRSLASLASIQLDRVYKTYSDRRKREVTVKRMV